MAAALRSLFRVHAQPGIVTSRAISANSGVRSCLPSQLSRFIPRSTSTPLLSRRYASQTTADEKVEEIQELYATAKDEFEIAAEETEKMTVYAEDDRAAAREELAKLQAAYRLVVNGQDKQLAEEVKSRVGQRIRELDNAVQAMEDIARTQD